MVSDQDFPEEYTDGSVLFSGQRFMVDPRALIPRLETEELVKYWVKILEKNPDIHTLADIGTWSGIIPLSIIKKIPRPLQTFAIDMSQDALDLAAENAKKLGCTGVQFFQWDLLQPVVSYLGNNTLENMLITANLPYVREKEINSWLIHEPRMAFLGGVQTGFELYERFFEQLFSWEKRPKNCHVVIEFWLWQRDIAETVLMWKDCSYIFFADLRGIERFAHICLSR